MTILETRPLYDGTLDIAIAGVDVTGAATRLSYSSSNPGGFGEASFRLRALNAYNPYYATVVKGAAVTIQHGSGPTTLFEGEVTNDVSHPTIEGGKAWFDVTCAGRWWRAGLREDFCVVFSDTDTGQWFTMAPSQAFTITKDGYLEIRAEKGQSFQAGVGAELYYWLSDGMGDANHNLVRLLGLRSFDVTGSNWTAEIAAAADPWSTWTVLSSWANTSSAEVAAFYNAGTGKKAFRLRLYSTTDVSGLTSDRYIRLRTPAVTANGANFANVSSVSQASPAVITTSAAHGLKAGDRVFIQGTDSTPTVDGWRTVATVPSTTQFTVSVNTTVAGGASGYVFKVQYLDAVMARVAGNTGVETTNLGASYSIISGGLGNLIWGLTSRPHESRAACIERLSMIYPSAVDYGFWDSGLFTVSLRGTPAANNDYVIDITDPGIDYDVHQATEESPSYVKVPYRFRDAVNGSAPDTQNGMPMAVYRPSEPTRTDARAHVDVWTDWADMSLETAEAQAIGDQILDWISENQYEGAIVIRTPEISLLGGGSKLSAYIRAGDCIQDLTSATGRLRISSVVVDADSGTVTLSIGENRRDFVARITRRYQRRYK